MPSTKYTLRKHHYYTHMCVLGHNVRYIYFGGSQSKECENHRLLSYLTLSFFRHLQSKSCDWYRNSLQEWGVWSDSHQNMEVAESQKVVAGIGHRKRQTPEGGSAEPRWAPEAAHSWIKRYPFCLLWTHWGSGARPSHKLLDPWKSHTQPHTKFNVSKSRSTSSPVGVSTERRENWGSLTPQTFLNISHYVLSLPNRGHNFPPYQLPSLRI